MMHILEQNADTIGHQTGDAGVVGGPRQPIFVRELLRYGHHVGGRAHTITYLHIITNNFITHWDSVDSSSANNHLRHAPGGLLSIGVYRQRSGALNTSPVFNAYRSKNSLHTNNRGSKAFAGRSVVSAPTSIKITMQATARRETP